MQAPKDIVGNACKLQNHYTKIKSKMQVFQILTAKNNSVIIKLLKCKKSSERTKENKTRTVTHPGLTIWNRCRIFLFINQ